MKQYNHNGLAGCVEQRRVRATGLLVGLYVAEQAGIDPDGGVWVCVCETHGTIANFETLKDARYHLPAVDWCEECQQQITYDNMPESFPLPGGGYTSYM